MRLVIDTNVFIPCGDKSKEKVEAIRAFGELLPEIAKKEEVEILLSTEVLKEYHQKIPVEIRRHGCHNSLPEFHSSIVRTLSVLIRIMKSRKKCTPKKIEPYNFHVIETSKLDRYEVREFVDDPEDEKFLKLALACASKGQVYLVSVDDGSLLKLKEDKFKSLCRKYCEAKNVIVCFPNEVG